MFVVGFVFRAFSGGGLPWFVGHECRAGLIDLVSRLDSELGLVFHEGVDVGGVKKAVFSLKPLMFLSDFSVVFPEKSSRVFPVESNVVFEPGARASMSVVLFRDDLASRFLNMLFSGMSELKINIKGYEFLVEKVSFELVDPRSIVTSGEPLDEIDVDFVTPTYFNPMWGDAKYKVLYPDITLMLASLISTSHQLTNINYPKPEELAKHVYVSGLDIKTPRIKEAKHEAPTGFVGWAKLRIREGASEEIKKTVTGLLKLGEVTNIGGNRSGGYGVIKLKTVKEKQETSKT